MTSIRAPQRLACMLSDAIIRPQKFTCFGRQISTFTSLINAPLRQPKVFSTKNYATASASNNSTSPDGRKKIIFLGTPDVAALVLDKLLAASKLPDSTFDIAAVVSQPGRPKGRSRQPQPSPVEKLAIEAGLSPELILCPERATDSVFLDNLSSIGPDLCITAAYGNYLPTKFLAIPRFGTLNIHPSLLPAYRGAAPVQRSLEDGIDISGVTVLYTVKEMDAGPILAQQKFPINSEIQAPELLNELFTLGTELLIKNLEVVWAGMAEKISQPQDGSKATHAPKITRDEGLLHFGDGAFKCHNKVRAFAPWPGTYHTFTITDAEGKSEDLELKILKSRVVDEKLSIDDEHHVVAANGSLKILCPGDGRVLELLEVQAPGRKAVAAKDFVNGLKGKTLKWRL